MRPARDTGAPASFSGTHRVRLRHRGVVRGARRLHRGERAPNRLGRGVREVDELRFSGDDGRRRGVTVRHRVHVFLGALELDAVGARARAGLLRREVVAERNARAVHFVFQCQSVPDPAARSLAPALPPLAPNMVPDWPNPTLVRSVAHHMVGSTKYYRVLWSHGIAFRHETWEPAGEMYRSRRRFVLEYNKKLREENR